MQLQPYLCGPSHADLAEYLRDIRSIPMLTPEEEAQLLSEYRRDRCQMARERLIGGHLRLVVYAARRYAGLGVPLQDLVEAGNVGLIRALEKFDPSRGTRFATYAFWWIKQGIRRALVEHGTLVRVPEGKRRAVRAVQEAVDRISARLGRAASEEEVSQELGVSPRTVSQLPKVRMTVATEEAAGDLCEIGSEEDRPDMQAEKRELRVKLRALVRSLPGKEAEIVRLHFGLSGRPPASLADVGRELGIPASHVSRLLRQALDRLHLQVEGVRRGAVA